jgi:hypothetical protein
MALLLIVKEQNRMDRHTNKTILDWSRRFIKTLLKNGYI